MMEPSSTDGEWTIGQLAEATGLTVRTLRHYEQIGLLTPARRTEARHRIYERPQVERLYLIRALKGLGVPLNQIAKALETESSQDILRRHLGHVEKEADRIALLRDRLRRLIAHLDEPLPGDRLVALIEGMTELEQFFTGHQLDRLAARRAALGPHHARQTRRDWAELAKLLRSQRSAGASPSSATVGSLAQRAREYIDQFTAGDQALDCVLEQMRTTTAPDDLVGWDGELLDYLDRALKALGQPQSARSSAARGARRS
jgi:MerR family transcriptional regulator, thiopeptide resistance regulator